MDTVSASNVLWGVLFVYVARKMLIKAEVVEVKREKIFVVPTEMKETEVGLKNPSVEARGPYAMFM